MPLSADLTARFAAALDRLGPFEPEPLLAVAVSGGPDSLALALLAHGWAAARGGDVLALIVDHRLRRDSATEAALTQDRLAGQGIAACILHIAGLVRGPALAERARDARYMILEQACASRGILHLLLGHHAADQAETRSMREAAGSGPRGLAGMAGLVETARVRLLRPLLAERPDTLRALLRVRGLAWVEDPSNRDPATLRARLRVELTQGSIAVLLAQATAAGRVRAAGDAALAAELAARVRLHPAGWAVLTGGPLSADALSAVIRAIAGRRYPPPSAGVAALAACPRAATLGGARLLPAGRHGHPGDWLVVREAAAMQPPIPATANVIWDGRFRLPRAIPGATIGPHGAGYGDAPGNCPAAARHTAAALWRDGVRLRSAPALPRLVFSPPQPLAGAPFLPI